MSGPRFLAIGMCLELGLLLLAALLGWFTQGAAFPFSFGFEAHALVFGVAATVPPVLFVVFATSKTGLSLAPLRGIYDFLKEILASPLRGMGLSGILLLSLGAGLGEEVLFRGVMTPWIGPVATSLAFGLCHAVSLPFFLFATAMGFYLSAVYAYSGNLLAPILVHALYDAVALRLYQKRFLGDRS